MPEIKAPLLSLKASGQIGGKRRGVTQRVVITVQDTPVFWRGGAQTVSAMSQGRFVAYARFLNPIHIQATHILFTFATVTGGQPLEWGIYNENGSKLLVKHTFPTAPSPNAVYLDQFPAVLNLQPGVYWLAYHPSVDATSMQIATYTDNNLAQDPYDAANGIPPASAFRDLTTNHTLDSSFSPALISAGSNILPIARIVHLP